MYVFNINWSTHIDQLQVIDWCKINNLSDKLVLVGNIDGWLMSYEYGNAKEIWEFLHKIYNFQRIS